jgi:hypothetical protein
MRSSGRSSRIAREGATWTNPLRVKSNLRSDFKVIWVVQSPRKKYSAGPVGQITFTTPPVSPEEGRIAIVTNAGWDVVDAAASRMKMESQGGFPVSGYQHADERR